MTRRLKLPEGKGINERGSSVPAHPECLFQHVWSADFNLFLCIEGNSHIPTMFIPLSRIDTFIHGGQKGQVVRNLFLTAIGTGIQNHLNLICTPGCSRSYALLYSLWIISAVQSAAQFPQMEEHSIKLEEANRPWNGSLPPCLRTHLYGAVAFSRCCFLLPPRIGNMLSKKQSRQET